MLHWNPPVTCLPGRACGQWERMRVSPTIATLRQPAKYWVISDAQLKRDLKGRTLKDVYRENRAARGVVRGYVPRWDDGSQIGGGLELAATWTGSPHYKKPLSLRDEYLAECAARGHVPHPASIDPNHPQNCHRLTAPKRETVEHNAVDGIIAAMARGAGHSVAA